MILFPVKHKDKNVKTDKKGSLQKRVRDDGSQPTSSSNTEVSSPTTTERGSAAASEIGMEDQVILRERIFI